MLASRCLGALLLSSPAPPRTSAIRCVRDEVPQAFAPDVDRGPFILGTPEPGDMPEVIDVLMDGFYKDVLTLAADEFSEEEMEVLRPVLEKFNGGLMWLTRILLSLEAVRRLATRLPSGGYGKPANTKDGLMLALQHRESSDIVGVIELMMQPCDGKVPGDVRLPRAPWASEPAPTVKEVPYISNLAVRSTWRSRGMGSSLLGACEQLARQDWGFDEVYLHAATDKAKLLEMYGNRGYAQLPDMDQPGWVLALSGREATRYHRKAL